MKARQMKTEYRMAEWAEIISQRNDSGESVEKFCENHGIKKHQYFYPLGISLLLQGNLYVIPTYINHEGLFSPG